MTDDFKDAPVSIGERRALTGDDCHRWTPRELLLNMLRGIDDGTLVPEGIVVCYFCHEGEEVRTGMRRSKTTVMEAVAMIEIAKTDLLRL